MTDHYKPYIQGLTSKINRGVFRSNVLRPYNTLPELSSLFDLLCLLDQTNHSLTKNILPVSRSEEETFRFFVQDKYNQDFQKRVDELYTKQIESEFDGYDPAVLSDMPQIKSAEDKPKPADLVPEPESVKSKPKAVQLVSDPAPETKPTTKDQPTPAIDMVFHDTEDPQPQTVNPPVGMVFHDTDTLGGTDEPDTSNDIFDDVEDEFDDQLEPEEVSELETEPEEPVFDDAEDEFEDPEPEFEDSDTENSEPESIFDDVGDEFAEDYEDEPETIDSEPVFDDTEDDEPEFDDPEDEFIDDESEPGNQEPEFVDDEPEFDDPEDEFIDDESEPEEEDTNLNDEPIFDDVEDEFVDDNYDELNNPEPETLFDDPEVVDTKPESDPVTNTSNLVHNSPRVNHTVGSKSPAGMRFKPEPTKLDAVNTASVKLEEGFKRLSERFKKN